jgi:hypothetical protein
MKMQHDTRQHEWDLQAAEAARAEENTQTFFKIAQEIGGRIVGPFAEKLAAGYAAKMGLGGAQEQATQEQVTQVPMGPMPGQQMPQQMNMMDPAMMEAMGYEVEKPGTVKLSPAQVETLKAERRHMTSQLKRLRKQQEEIERQINKTQNRVEQVSGTATTSQPVEEGEEEIEVSEEMAQQIAGEKQQVAMIQSASNEQIEAAIRDVDQSNPAHRAVLNKLLAEKARRAQFHQPTQAKTQQAKTGYAAITANVFAQRTQTPTSQRDVLVREQELYGVPDRFIEQQQQQQQRNVVEIPRELMSESEQQVEEEEPEQKAHSIGTVATPRNMNIADEQTGTVAAIGSGGLKNQKPRSEQEEAAMMYGYGNPMSFGVSVNKDDIKFDKADNVVPPEIKDDEDNETNSDEEIEDNEVE